MELTRSLWLYWLLIAAIAAARLIELRISRARQRLMIDRGVARVREPHFRAIRDQKGRIMVVMTHNTDVADSWEREGEDPDYFHQFSPDGYALGVDVLIHAMTH